MLLKFRTSVFLFCSAEAGERGGESATEGGGGREDVEKSAENGAKDGPFELTLRRQGVMSAENLEAVAEHLQSLQTDGTGGPGVRRRRRRKVSAANTPGADGVAAAAAAATTAAQAGAGARRRARDWMRVEVGRAALCGGETAGDDDALGVAFSTRVAALLLSRSGERGGPPTAQGGGGRARPGSEENSGPVIGGRARAAATAMAVAEAQFGRDPWPEEDLPRASQQAARVFLPQGASRRGACSRAASGVEPSGTPSPSPVRAADGSPRSAVAAAKAGAVGEKRRRQGSEEPSCVPPQYVGLLGQLPRDSRHLLARLGHQGYVKVLESLLRGFLEISSAAAAPAKAADIAAEVFAPAATAAADSPSHAGIGVDNGDLVAYPDLTPASSTPYLPRYPGTTPPGSDDNPGLGPWEALQAGRPHPSLSGLVEPPELASVEVARMVLPIPNPFYRRVLHALCRVHGLVSCGGETRRRAGAGGKDGGARAVAGHRTVEVTRGGGGGGGGGGGWARVTRPGGKRGGADDGAVLTLVPVEVLLAER